MAGPQPYKLMIKSITESNAKLLKFFPMKSFVEREDYDISFQITNIGEQDFPRGHFFFDISWPSDRVVRRSFPIKPLAVNETCNTDKFTTGALFSGYGLILIATIGGTPIFYPHYGKVLQVDFYTRKKPEDKIDPSVAFDHVKAKTWEEIYEFWALIVATIGLGIIALEKIVILLTKLTT